jgi:hypothetical protein
MQNYAFNNHWECSDREKKNGKKMYDGKHRPFGKFLIVKKLSFL